MDLPGKPNMGKMGRHKKEGLIVKAVFLMTLLTNKKHTFLSSSVGPKGEFGVRLEIMNQSEVRVPCLN